MCPITLVFFPRRNITAQPIIVLRNFKYCLAKHRRPIQCGAVRVVFIVRKRITEVPVQPFNTPRGTIFVSTPEATALDLVGYAHHVGGLDNAAAVLNELAEKIDPEKLA